jgi:hypothetical protein
MIMIRFLLSWTAFLTLISCKEDHQSNIPKDVMVSAEGKKDMIILTDRPA